MKSEYGFTSKRLAKEFLSSNGFTKQTESGYYVQGNQSGIVRRQVNGKTFRIDFYRTYC